MKRYIHSRNEELYGNDYVEGEGILGMSRVGELPMRGSTYEIYVNTDDGGQVPHFHVRDKKEWEKFHTCVRIDKAEYFLHGTKIDKFNNKEKKQLEEFMNQPYRTRKGDSIENNWEHICSSWNDNNSSVIISEDVVQPDYRLLN